MKNELKLEQIFLSHQFESNYVNGAVASGLETEIAAYSEEDDDVVFPYVLTVSNHVHNLTLSKKNFD